MNTFVFNDWRWSARRLAMIAGCLAGVLAPALASAQSFRAPGDMVRSGDPTWLVRTAEEASAGGWLGVQLAPVPPALAEHLRLDQTGVMVRNVFKDSPADQAAIHRYDVIIEANGQKVADSVEAFAANVRGKKPGDPLTLVLYHRGEKTNVTIKLGQPPASLKTLEPKYEETPDGSDSYLRGRIFRRGPQGWMFEDLGPLPHLRDVPGALRHYMEEMIPDMDTVTEGRRVDREGQVLHVRRQEDGTIVVKRYRQKDGESKADVTTFNNLEDLKTKDREAYDLLESARQERQMLGRPDHGPTHAWPEWAPDQKTLRRWHEQADKYEDSLRQWQKRMEEYGQGDKRWKDWYNRFFQGPLEHLNPATPNTTRKPATQPSDATAPPPNVRFEAQLDGSITVHIRENDAELTKTYESKETLRQQSPRLYEQYQSLQERFR